MSTGMNFYNYGYNAPDDGKKKKGKKHRTNDISLYDDPYDRLREGLIPGLGMVHTPDPKREGKVVPDYMILDMHADSGFHLGGINKHNRYVGKSEDEDGMIAVYGGTGSGKSYNNAKPTIRLWKSPIFAIDIKGELAAEARRARRYPKVLKLTSEGGSCKYEPFYFLEQDGVENLSQNATELAHAIIPLPPSIPEPFWIESARNVLTAAILYYCHGMKFIETMIRINSLGFEALIDTIWNGKNETAKAFINRDVLMNPKMFAGISEEFRNHIRVFATDTTIQKAFLPTDDPHCEFITWDDLKTDDIFIQIEQRRLGQWSRVIAMIVTQLIRALESRPDKHDPDGEEMKPVLMLLDEFPQLGKMDVIANALATLRSKKVTIALFCQSLADLTAIYGEDTSRRINDNCAYKLVLNASDFNTQRYFSELVGTKKTISKSLGASCNPADESLSGISLNVGESSQLVIQPYEFASLCEAVLLHPEGFSRVVNISHYIPGHPKNPNNRD